MNTTYEHEALALAADGTLHQLADRLNTLYGAPYALMDWIETETGTQSIVTIRTGTSFADVTVAVGVTYPPLSDVPDVELPLGVPPAPVTAVPTFHLEAYTASASATYGGAFISRTICGIDAERALARTVEAVQDYVPVPKPAR